MSRPGRCPRRCSSACPRRPSRRARTASSGRWSTPASSGRRTASSSTWPRPSCPSRPPASTCRSRWAFWPAAGSSSRSGSSQYAVVGELALDGSDAAGQRRALDGHRRGEGKRLRGIARAGRQRRRGRRRRRDRGHPGRQPGPGRRLLRRRAGDRARAVAARRNCSRPSADTRTTSPTCGAGAGQAGHRHRRRRRAQPPDDRPARQRQDDAGQARADDPARRSRPANRSRRRASTARWAGCPTASR